MITALCLRFDPVNVCKVIVEEYSLFDFRQLHSIAQEWALSLLPTGDWRPAPVKFAVML